MPVTVVVDAGNAHVKVCARTAVGDVARRTGCSSVWAGPGTLRTGAAAEEAAEVSPEHLVTGWVDRLGDEVPFHTEAGTLTAEQLLGKVLEQPLAEVAEELGEPVDRVALVTPDEWSPVRRRRVRAAVEDALSGSAVVVLPRAVGLRQSLADGADREGQGGGVLVIDVGASAVRARVLADGDLSRPVVETGVGGDLLDDRVFRHVLDQVPPALRASRGTPEARRELGRTRRACRNARTTLSSETETTVPVLLASAASELRLVRPEVESLLDDDLHRILDVGQRAVDAGRAPLSRVVLLGGCAHTPRLAQLASARWSCPVDRPDDPSCFALVGALEVLERETSADQAATEPTSSAVAAPEADRAEPAAAVPAGAGGGPSDERAVVASAAPPSAGDRPAAPGWLRDGDGGAHLTQPRRRLQPALLAAASALVLAGGAGAVMTFLPDMDPASAVSRIVTRTETTVTPDLPAAHLPGPWAPGATPTVPEPPDAGADAGSPPGTAAPERFLPGVPALPPATSTESLAAPGGPATVAGRAAPATRAPAGARPRTSGTTSPSGATPQGGTAAGGSTTAPATPGTSAPGTTAPGTTAPGTTAPGTVEPEPTTPGTVEPEPTTPGTVEPEPTTPGTVEPEPTTPGTVEPEPTTPGTVEPEPDPVPDPGPTEPGPGDTAPAGPGASTTPDPTDPTP